jgi:cytochrome c
MKTTPFKIYRLLGMLLVLAATNLTGLASQRVEGFDQVEFHYEANRTPAGRTFVTTRCVVCHRTDEYTKMEISK